MFSNLVADGILTTNPVKLVKFLQEDSEPGRVLNREEERLYLIAASQPLQDYATVLVETGLRPDELCKLAIRDIFVEVDRPYLIVKQGKTKAARAHRAIVETGNGRPEKTNRQHNREVYFRWRSGRERSE